MVGIKHESMRKEQTSHKNEHNTLMCFPLEPVFTRDKRRLPNFIDEPTGGLDPLMQREFFEIIRERSSQGTTVFLSSHILSEVQHNCSRAAIIREGRIIACDSVDTLAKTNAKRVSLRGTVDLTDLTGIRDQVTVDGITSFLFGGDINQLLRQLSDGNILDIHISEPDLEEIFLHYYEKDGDRV